VEALGYTDAGAEAQAYVRAFAAESLGRLRAAEAVAPLGAALAKEKNPDLRERYQEALSRLGDPAGLPALRAAVEASPAKEREPGLKALSRLGGEAERGLVEAGREACGQACPPARLQALEGMLARLDAAKICGADQACWTGKLADPRAEVRDRAALEVRRAGGAAQVDALTAAVIRQVDSDAELEARYHAVLALDLVARRQPLGAKGLVVAGAIDKLLAADKGRTLTAAVDEDALRLAGRLRKAAR
jgi:HEAT repeat protein